MKVKAPSKRPTRSNINTSTKSTKRGGRTTSRRRNRDDDDRGGRGRKPVKKQDNTKLFIGIGVGVFFLLIIIIAAANSGGSSNNNSSYSDNGGSTKKKVSLLPLNVRKQIYREYIAEAEKYDQERAAAMDAIGSADERRKKGPQLVREQKTKENNLRVRLSDKYRKKYGKQYPNLASTFVRKIVSEGDKNSWR